MLIVLLLQGSVVFLPSMVMLNKLILLRSLHFFWFNPALFWLSQEPYGRMQSPSMKLYHYQRLEQVMMTLKNFFLAQNDLYLLQVDTAKVLIFKIPLDLVFLSVHFNYSGICQVFCMSICNIYIYCVLDFWRSCLLLLYMGDTRTNSESIDWTLVCLMCKVSPLSLVFVMFL